jgi:hypothetical protein
MPTAAKTNHAENLEQRAASRPMRDESAAAGSSGVVRVAERHEADLDIDDPYYDVACTD